MKTDPVLERLREASWRRKLTPAEEAQLQSLLAAHADARADWAAEAALNGALNRLPAAPVPSNFTARVLDAVERETRTPAKTRHFGWSWLNRPLRWLPRTAFVVLVVGVGSIAYHHDVIEKRKARAQSLLTVSELPAMASPEILEDFDAIQAMGQAPAADQELLSLLQ
ncbi:MAG TPA: hypothetical protein VJA21_07780 [Verrucomicrobiae bacterium]